jgi:hypothetical protein
MRRPTESRAVALGRLALVSFAAATAMHPSRAPATVEEQRSRLPPPAQCTDPVAGTWRSHDFVDDLSWWQIFTLDIRRVEGSDTQLVGTITNEYWEGSADRPLPGPCAGNFHHRVAMDAKGEVDGGRIRFTGHEPWRLEAVLCGRFNGLYDVDNFSGTIDEERLEFQSVNNAGWAVDYPTVFRRIACQPGDAPREEPQVAVEVPPMFPPEEDAAGRGCAGGGR